MSFFDELVRRKFFRTTGIYIAGCWVLLQVSALVVPLVGLPQWAVSFIFYLMIAGFPLCAALSWMFDFTRAGIVNHTDRSLVQLNLASPMLATVMAFSVAVTYGAFRLALPPADDVPSIVVIPFANLTGDETREFLSDGITEEILNQLYLIDNMKVIGRRSVFALKEKNLGLVEIGEQLGVEHVLEGNLQVDGDVARIAVRLINIASGEPVWADTMSGDMSDFEFQDQVTGTVVSAISGAFGRTAPPVSRPQTREVLAREHFMRGRYYYEKRGRENMGKAREHFEQAIDIDPLYANAWAGLAQVYFMNGDDRMEAATDKALELDPENPVALIAQAQNSALVAWNFKEALDQSRHALDVAPGHPDVVHFSAILLALTGQFENSLALQKKAAELNPLYPPLLEGVGHRYRYMWRYVEAIEIYERSRAQGFDRVNNNLFEVYGWMGRIEEATEAVRLTNESGELDDWDRMMLAYYAGDKVEASRLYQASFRPNRPPVEKANVGVAFYGAAYGGDLDYAFAVLEIVAEQKNTQLVQIMRRRTADEMYTDPRWETLWNHPNLKPLFELYLEAGDAPWIEIMNAATQKREAD